MATIVVTGAVGGAGSWVVDNLADHGHEVIGLDLERPPGSRENAQFYAVDLTDQGETWELVLDHDPDTVVHFAAIPHPNDDPGSRVFTNNVESTYAVLEAAGRVGADVIWTSSESAYGTVFAAETWLPDYLPLDEAHPLRPEDPYGTSKVVGEEIGKMVARRHGVSVTSIRPSTINYPGRYYTESTRESFDPETASPSGNFWSYVDVRDVVSMVDAALDVRVEGHEAFLAVADENYLDRPTAEIIERVAGDLPEECDLEGDQAALSNAKAEERLGWTPAHSWREAEDEDIAGPSFLE